MKKYIISLAFLIIFSLSAYASDEVKVGLTTFWEDVDEVELNNKTLNLGYYDGERFNELLKVKTSGEGFTARRNTMDLYISDLPVSEIGSFDAAKIVRDGEVYYVSSEDRSNEFVKFSYLDANTIIALDYYEGTVFLDDNGNYGYDTCLTSDDLRDGVPLVYVGQRAYRGCIELVPWAGKITVVNIVDMDEYLYSVVCSEVFPGWNEESLKAQAVAARTYAKYNSGEKSKFSHMAYDLADDQRSQVYKGYNIEDERVRDAVDACSGEMIYYDDELINAFFFSTSGGSTSDSEDIWTYEVPYLRGVPDIFETDPERKPWINEMAMSTIEKKLAARDIYIGSVISAYVNEVNDDGIVMALQINGTNGSTVLQKEKIRGLGLYSRKFVVLNEAERADTTVSILSAGNNFVDRDIEDVYVLSNTEVESIPVSKQAIIVSDKTMRNIPLERGKSGHISFAGMGWGHGVGLSQSGAKCMAENGYDYKDILKHYYTGVEVRLPRP